MTNINELTAKCHQIIEEAKARHEDVQLYAPVLRWFEFMTLTEELEAAETRIAELEARVEAAEKRYENRTPTEWAYGQACAAIMNHRARADAAEARIAELEARTLTVKLKQYDEFWIEHIAPGCPDGYAKGFIDGRNYGEKQIKTACDAAGIKLQIEGE